MVCLYLLRCKQIINPDRFLGLSGILVLFDKLEFDELKNTFVIFNHSTEAYNKSKNNANNQNSSSN